MYTRSWSHIQNMIRGHYRIGIMFYNYDTVTKITEFKEGVYQFLVITLMQPDTWLIEDI